MPYRRGAWRAAPRYSREGPVEGLRPGARALRPRPRGRARRGLRLPRPQRRGQVDDDAPAARPDQADRGLGDAARARQPRQSLEIRRRVGFLPGDFALYPKLTGAAMLDYLAELRGGVDRRVRDELAERFDAAARPPGARALDRQPPEARADPGVHARARAADPRRADRRARPAGAAELPRAARRGRGAGPDRVPLLAHALRGRAGRRPRRDPAPRPAGRGRLAREPARDRRPAARDRVRGRRRRASRSSARSPASATRRSTGRISSSPSRARPTRWSRRSRRTRSARSAAAKTTSRRSSCASTATRRRMSAPGLPHGAAPARCSTSSAALGMVLVILMVGALFPAVGGSIGKLDLPRGRHRAAGRRRLRDDRGLDAQRDRRGLRAAGDRRRGHHRRRRVDGRRGGGRDPRRWCWPTRSTARAWSLAKAAAVAVGVVVIALGTFAGLVVGVAVGGGGVSLGNLGALSLHLAFFGLRSARSRWRSPRTGRRPSPRRRRGFAVARLPDQRLRAAGRRHALAQVPLAVPLLRGPRPDRQRRRLGDLAVLRRRRSLLLTAVAAVGFRPPRPARVAAT